MPDYSWFATSDQAAALLAGVYTPTAITPSDVTVTTAASGIVTAVLSSAVTGALTAPGLLKVRVSAVDGASKVRVFPDDADLYVTLRVQR